MYRVTPIAKSPREHFMRTVEDEFSKFESKERAFRQAEREERAAKLHLPLDLPRSTADEKSRRTA